jgi:hypothetical protein
MTKMAVQQEFWNWFNRHEEELFAFEADQERIFDQLATALQRVDRDLTFEFGPRAAIREFVISAGGIKRAFPSVSALALAAPTLDRWRVMAFRPRRSLSNVVEFRGKHVEGTGFLANCRYLLHDRDSKYCASFRGLIRLHTEQR